MFSQASIYLLGYSAHLCICKFFVRFEVTFFVYLFFLRYCYPMLIKLFVFLRVH